jgi:DNA-binding protein HU-beta
MNKAEIIAKVAEKSNLSRAAAGRVMAGLIDAIENALKAGDKFTLTGFGTFEILNRSTRKGRNPRTGVVVEIPARKAVKFRAGKTLKNAMK